MSVNLSRRKYRAVLLGASALVSGVSLGGMIGGGAAFAQTTASSAPTEVIVTARKRSEKLQDVPLSITALSGADLKAAGVQDLRDITFLTPGLTLDAGSGANYFSHPIIRGQTDLGSGDNNVPVFFDGIYISNTSAIDFGLVDLARVEVIKGPVSATYGRSAYAGAINYITAKPTNFVRGELDATGGSDGKYALSGRISGPLIQDVLKGGISAGYDHFDGTYHDSVTGQDAGGYKKRDVLANLDWTPNEHLEIRPVVYYGDDEFASSAAIFAPANCGVNPGLGSFTATFCGKVPSGNTFQGPFVASPGQYGQTGNTRKVLTTNLQASLTYDWGTITSLTGYNTFKTNSYNEFDDQDFGTPTATRYLPAGAVVGGYGAAGPLTGQTVLTPLHFGYTNRNNDFSQELRFSKQLQSNVHFSIGGYYANSGQYQDLNLARGTCSVPAGQYISDYFAVPCGQTKSGQQTVFKKDDKIYAGFASIDWEIVKNLSLTVELRNTKQESTYTDIQAIFAPFPTKGYSTSTASGFYPLTGGVPGSLSKSFWSTTSRTSLTYKLSQDVNVYVSAANGDKAGGFNNNTTYPTYNPETNWTYEAGFKSELFERRLLLNADVYFINASHFQISAPPPGATLPGGFINTNYGGLKTPGVEVAAAYTVNPWLKVSGSVAYTDPEFKNDAFDFGDKALCASIPSCAGRIQTVGPNQAVSLHGLRPPFESNLTANAALDVDYPLGGGLNLIGRVDYRYEGKQYYQYPIDTGYFGPKDIVNLRIGLEKGPYSLTGYVRNLTNDKTPVTVQDAAVTGASNFQAGYFPVAVLPDGRTYGVTLRYKFGS